jgi:hypothetical protein
MLQYAFVYTVPPTIRCGLLRNASASAYQWATRFINFYVPLAAIWVVYLGIIYKFKKSGIKVRRWLKNSVERYNIRTQCEQFSMVNTHVLNQHCYAK